FYLSLVLLLCFVSQLFAEQEFVGKVNKHKIKTTDYMLVVKSEYESFFLEHNASPSPQEQKLIEQKAWNRMVEGYVLKDIYDKYKIKVSSKELLDTLKHNIPEIVKKSPQFNTTAGEFNLDAYESSLVNNKPVDLSWLKNFYYTSYIPMAKLKQQIIKNRKISEAEIKKHYIAQQNTIDAQTVFFNNSDFIHEVEVSSQEIQDYYRNHISDFEIQASCHLKWVKFPIRADQSDSLFAKNKADSLYHVVKKNNNMSVIASKFSDGIYNSKKGYAGYMELNLFPDDVRQTLANAEINEILPPYYMNGSYYIFQLTEKTVSMVKLMVIQIDIKPTEQTHARIKNDIKKFREMCNNIGFDSAVREFRYQMFEKDSLSVSDVFIPEFGPSENVVRLALRTPAGVVFDPIKNDKLKTYVVFYVQRNTVRSFKKIQDVSEQIINAISEEKARDFTYQKAQNWLKANAGKMIFTAQSEGKEIIELKDFTINSTIKDKVYPDFNYAILSYDKKQPLAIKEKDCTIIAIVNQSKDVSMLDFALYKDQIKKRLQQINQDKYFDEFLKTEKAKAKIKDYRPKN
ncbi:MAG TPA: peptidylprolyl isomerase, partial [Candidatus Cloacimonadota bacterium]|nr:peptidylprolyl isomerase [Candidatus Cloacimonadota bacterium]